jgi:uncharacterized protein YhaN
VKINDVKIDGFGVWSGLRLDGISQQLTVIYGPNEAGKTTLMQFLRAMLYGFSPERRARYVPPVAGGDAGGSLEVTAGSEPWTVRRHIAPGAESEDLEVDDSAGEIVDPAELQQSLGEIDERLYNSVFAFGLDEIQELRTLSESEASRLLYDLSLGLEHVSLSDVLAQLRHSRERLLASDDRPCLIPQLIAQRERLAGDVRELHKSTTEYLELRLAAEQLQREIARREVEQQEASRRLRSIEQAQSLAPAWRTRSQLDAQLAGARSPHVLPGDAGQRCEHLARRIQQRRTQRAELRSGLQKLQAELAAVGVNQALVRLTPRLEALSEQQQWMGALADETRKVQDEIDVLQAQRDEHRQRFGLAAQKGVTGPLKPQTRANLRSAAKALRDARRELKTLHAKAASERQTVGSAAGKLQSALSGRTDGDLQTSIEKSGQLAAQLRRRVQLDERLDQMDRREADLTEEARLALKKQVMPGWLVGGLGGAFSLGTGLVLAGLFLPASIFVIPAIPSIVVGAGLVGASGATKFQLQRSASHHLDRCQRQLAELQQQREASVREREQLDKALPRGGGPFTVRLQKAEAELAELEQLLPLAAEHQSAEQSAQSADEQKRLARTQWQKGVQRWQAVLGEAGLSKSLKPAQLRGLLQHHQELHDLERRLGAKHEEMAERLGRLGALQSRIMQLAAEIGLKSDSEDPLAVLREMLTLLQKQQTSLERRQAIETQLVENRKRTKLLSKAIGKLKQRKQALLVELGVQDEAQLRRRLDQQAELARLEQERAELHAEIQKELAASDEQGVIAELLGSSANLAALHAQTQSVADNARTTLAQLFERRGQLAQQIKHLADDRRLPEKQFELELVSGRLREAIARWRVVAVCGMLLEAVRDYYERERQPEALREASQHLERLTSGKYRRVWTPFGERELRVDDAEGKSLPVDVLSRGTREQLFLALRLSLISLYARRGVRLPVILDDVLVNFDAPRTKAAASVLRDFSRDGHQVLLFTCHEHISKLFKSLRADVRVLPDRGAALLPAKPEPAQPKRRAKPEPMVDEAEEEVLELPVETIVISAPAVVERAAPPTATPEIVEAGMLEASPAIEQRIPSKPRPGPVPPAVAPVVDVEAKVQADPVPPAPKPVKRERKPAAKRLRRVERRVEQVRWDAEEFSGELVDRVAHSRVVELVTNERPENGHDHSHETDGEPPIVDPARD